LACGGIEMDQVRGRDAAERADTVKRKKTVFLTGASGNMGREGLRELLARRDRCDIVVLVLPTAADRKLMSACEKEPGVRVVWGDLTRYEDVLSCVTGADYVLHVGGMVSPAADSQPERTAQVNIGAVENILRAIQAQPDPGHIRLVYIGSVAQTGDRNPPVHWGRAGDPIKIGVQDHYALTKTVAERMVVESGLRYWVSLRQTAVAHLRLLDAMDPIMFHVPINGVFEWVTARDSGRLLANVCEDDVPEEFWRRVYNIGGGESCRITNHEFMERSFRCAGITNPGKVCEANWFALGNFHGHWFEDSDTLERYLHFRSESMDDFFAELGKRARFRARLAAAFPSAVKRRIEKTAHAERGTLFWLEHGMEQMIRAAFGSRERWEQIPPWGRFPLLQPSRTPSRLNHGYDETRPKADLDLGEMRRAAAFRGGECLSGTMAGGDLGSPLQWRCCFGHRFAASPTLILLAGHWCPECLATGNNAEVAGRSEFLAQVWSPVEG
jgi:nucleoside-diphosphate-sugar epimerase